MNLPVSVHSGITVAAVSGRIDHASSEAFAAALEPLLAACTAGSPPLVLDFAGVSYISSVGLRVLMTASRRAKSQNGVLAIAGMQSVVQEVFAIARFNLVMPCYVSVDAAAKVLGS